MFETALWEVNGRARPATPKWLNLPAAIGLHLLFGLTMVVLGYWRVGAVPEPSLPSVFVQFAPPPPLELGSPRGSRERPRPAQPAAPPTTPVQPQPEPTPTSTPAVLPDSAPVEAGSDLPFGSDEGVLGGDPEGSKDGVLGGVDDGQEGAPEPAQDTIIVVGGDVLEPVKLYAPQPRYTEMARKARREGVVIVQAVIDQQGNVTGGRVLRGLGLGLDEAALSAIETWRFEPATLHGRPVAVYYNVTVRFQLQ